MTTISPLHDLRDSVLCLHCSGASGRQWDALEPLLGPAFELLRPDLLGYGAQAWLGGDDASLDAEAARLLPLLRGRPQGVHLVGHSFGGAVALQVALRWPQYVRSLTLYEPVRFALLFGHPDDHVAAAEITGIGRRVGLASLCGRQSEAGALFVDYWSGPGSWNAMPESARQKLAQRMPKVRSEFEALFADDVPLSAYRRLGMPVCLIGGGRSPLPARRVSERLLSVLPRGRHVVLQKLDHMGPVNRPAEFFAALPAWLKPVEQAEAA